ncbi:Putative inner membrane protein YjeT (clustered with HflC) [Candidatus Phaeomarinobacter ectocarpi]|uniref:Putative inner membrane protein YjeT (Clustered with HflC) n=1 Tax=Candidatus Phaeomarinibacter ectocarpi TaxID=1458461 RepID=X5MDP0_9HYPH|nr:DUF2065 domain-containing protein [Candidatus Phaeomarinobacter ectocarpi]CDO58644.1 Putative inner membrane protein YjeT (clustered with HflC) [Candidatus Phaeomarinobacter ectocarpi]
MTDLVVAIGLVLVIEGVAYAAFPQLFRRMLKMVEDTPDASLRMGGLLAASMGLVIVWLVRG